MALGMRIVRDDGTAASYIRLVTVRFPEFRKDNAFQKRGQLTFNVYRDEKAAKEENRQPAKVWYIEVDAPFFAGISDPFSMTMDEMLAEVYKRAASIPELRGAVNLV